jgi:uncharacterized protein (TIRG00374 family)
MHIVIKAIGNKEIKFRQWFRLFVEGRLLNKVAPQLGNVYRGIELKNKNKIPLTKYTASYLFFSWFDTVFNLFLVIVAITLTRSEIPNSKIILNIAIFIFLILIFLPKTIKFIEKININIPKNILIKKFSSILQRLKSSINLAFNNYIFFQLGLLGIISGALMCSRILLGFEIFNIIVGLTDIILIYTIYKISTMIVITPGNIGIQELSIGMLSEFLGHGLAVGIAVTLALRLYGYFLFLALWITFLLSDLGDIKRKGEKCQD